MPNVRNATITTVTLHLILVGLIVSGWIMNLITVFHTANDPITGKFILRAIGCFVVPLGSILGWIF